MSNKIVMSLLALALILLLGPYFGLRLFDSGTQPERALPVPRARPETARAGAQNRDEAPQDLRDAIQSLSRKPKEDDRSRERKNAKSIEELLN